VTEKHRSAARGSSQDSRWNRGAVDNTRHSAASLRCDSTAFLFRIPTYTWTIYEIFLVRYATPSTVFTIREWGATLPVNHVHHVVQH